MALSLALAVAGCGPGGKHTHAIAVDPSELVTDGAGVLTRSDRQDMVDTLRAWEQSRGDGAQLHVVTTPPVDDLDGYADRAFRAARMGRPGSDNGIMVVVSPAQRRVRIEIGKGLRAAVDGRAQKAAVAAGRAEYQLDRWGPGITATLVALEDDVRRADGTEGGATRPASRGGGATGALVGVFLVALAAAGGFAAWRRRTGRTADPGEEPHVADE